MVARLKDVAERAGVSIKTASNVVNGYEHVSAVTRQRVTAAIEDLGYRRHAVQGMRACRKRKQRRGDQRSHASMLRTAGGGIVAARLQVQ